MKSKEMRNKMNVFKQVESFLFSVVVVFFFFLVEEIQAEIFFSSFLILIFFALSFNQTLWFGWLEQNEKKKLKKKSLSLSLQSYHPFSIWLRSNNLTIYRSQSNLFESNQNSKNLLDRNCLYSIRSSHWMR